MKRLYVETNFIMSVSTGRTPRALDLLEPRGGLEIAIPLVCFMEAHQAFLQRKKGEVRFKQPFQSQIKDLRRDRSGHAQEAVRSLAAADAAMAEVLEESEQRLVDVVARLSDVARLVVSSPPLLRRQMHSHLSDPTDDLIAASIMEDAGKNRVDEAAFFTEDRDFSIPSLLSAMKGLGIEKITDVDESLRWCHS